MSPSIFSEHDEFPLGNEGITIVEAVAEAPRKERPIRKWRDVGKAKAVVGDSLQRSSALAIANDGDLNVGRRGQVPTTIPQLVHSWESTSSSSSFGCSVGTPGPSAPISFRRDQAFGSEDYNRYAPSFLIRQEAHLRSSVDELDELFELSLDDDESPRNNEAARQVNEQSPRSNEVAMQVDELELLRIMGTPKKAPEAGVDMDLRDSMLLSQSMLFSSPIPTFFQLPSPELSPLIEMGDLPVPLWTGL